MYSKIYWGIVMSETKNWIRKVGDGIAAWIGPACIGGVLLLANFLYNLKHDVEVVYEIKETVNKMDKDSTALWGTTAEQNAKIQRLEATIDILEKLVINPAYKVGLVDDNELPKNKPMEVSVDDYMMEQRTKFPKNEKD